MVIRFGMLTLLILAGIWMAFGDGLGPRGSPLRVMPDSRVSAPWSLIVGYMLLVIRSEAPWFLTWLLNVLENKDMHQTGPIGFLVDGRSWTCQQIREAIEMDEARRIRRKT